MWLRMIDSLPFCSKTFFDGLANLVYHGYFQSRAFVKSILSLLKCNYQGMEKVMKQRITGATVSETDVSGWGCRSV